MILDIFTETFSMIWGLVDVVVPYVLGALAAAALLAAAAALVWAFPRNETNPADQITPGASDWLGQP